MWRSFCSRLLRTLKVRAWCRAVFTGVGFGCRGGIAHGGVVVLTGLAVLAGFAIDRRADRQPLRIGDLVGRQFVGDHEAFFETEQLGAERGV
mgnify:CR=1 FL=1